MQVWLGATRLSSSRAKLPNSLHHRFGCLTWEEVTRNRYDASLVRAGKKALVAFRRLRRRDPIAFAVQDNRRHRDHRLSGKFDFDLFKGWIAPRRPIAVAVGMDRDLDKIGVVEGFGGSLVFGVIETVIRRPQLPQFTTERPTIGG